MDHLILYSSVKWELKKKLLFRGIVLGSLGTMIFLLAGAFLQESILGAMGFPLLLVVGGLITLGMLPYKKVSLIETKPHKILAEEDKTLCFFLHGKQVLSIPRDHIERIAYFEKPLFYGIAVHLKNRSEVISHPKMHRFVNQIKKEYHCDLFLPYFSQHSFDSLYHFQFSSEE